MMIEGERGDQTTNLPDSSSEVKERKINAGERNDSTVNSSSTAICNAIISPGEMQSGIDPSDTFLSSSSQSSGEDHDNFQVIGITAGESGEPILVIAPLLNSASDQIPLSQAQEAHQPLLINGIHFQGAQHTGSPTGPFSDSSVLAAQFELIKSTCPTLSCQDEKLREGKAVIPISKRELGLFPTHATFQETTDLNGREASVNHGDNVLVVYTGKENSDLDYVIHQDTTEATTNVVKLSASVAESVFGPNFNDFLNQTQEIESSDDTFRKCVVCLQKRPITREIFDPNNTLNQNMAVLTAHLYIDPRDEDVNDVGMCPECLDQLLNWHAFSTAIRTRHDAVKSWPGLRLDQVTVNDASIKARLYQNPKRMTELKNHYWAQSGQHSYLTRRRLTDSDFDFLCEYLAKYPPPPEKERTLVQTYLHSSQKLTHIFCIYCRTLVENGKSGFLLHMRSNHPLETKIHYPCELCGMLNTEENDAYFSHWISHLYSERCEKCDEKFPNKRVLRQHLLHRHQQKRHRPNKRRQKTKHIECPHCETFLSSYSSLKKHIDYKHYIGPLQHTCPQCDKQFRWRYLLVKHERGAHRMKKPSAKPVETQKRTENVSTERVEKCIKIVATQSISTTNDNEKVLTRHNYSPDINPDAHGDGYSCSTFSSQGDTKEEQESPKIIEPQGKIVEGNDQASPSPRTDSNSPPSTPLSTSNLSEEIVSQSQSSTTNLSEKKQKPVEHNLENAINGMSASNSPKT